MNFAHVYLIKQTWSLFIFYNGTNFIFVSDFAHILYSI